MPLLVRLTALTLALLLAGPPALALAVCATDPDAAPAASCCCTPSTGRACFSPSLLPRNDDGCGCSMEPAPALPSAPAERAATLAAPAHEALPATAVLLPTAGDALGGSPGAGAGVAADASRVALYVSLCTFRR